MPSVERVLARTLTHALVGLETRRVEVEAHLENGVPGFAIVGLADRACQEAKHRQREPSHTRRRNLLTTRSPFCSTRREVSLPSSRRPTRSLEVRQAALTAATLSRPRSSPTRSPGPACALARRRRSRQGRRLLGLPRSRSASPALPRPRPASPERRQSSALILPSSIALDLAPAASRPAPLGAAASASARRCPRRGRLRQRRLRRRRVEVRLVKCCSTASSTSCGETADSSQSP